MIEEIWIASPQIQHTLAEKYGLWAIACIQNGDAWGAYYYAVRAAFHARIGLEFNSQYKVVDASDLSAR